MLRIKYNNLKAIIISLTLLSVFNIAHATEFPKSLEERKQDKMGSILGDDGLQLNFSKADNTSLNAANKNSRQQVEEVNYIWLAALESVKFMPLNSADYNGGVIITDWISNDKRPTERFKISIYIKGKALSLNSFDVNIYGEEFKRGRWITDRSKHEFLKTKMTNDILLIAKDLHAKNKRNKE
ncbi:MAG: hypothetical protein K0R02_833 [Rickettsiaceae bacterium]|jgi:hypothetical protein|nr:hypothetical protein [Rickettsiaceae bacterium]